MTVRPSYIFLSELDISDPNFPAKCMAWTVQTRSEVDELVALGRASIATSKTLLAETDRLLTRRYGCRFFTHQANSMGPVTLPGT